MQHRMRSPNCKTAKKTDFGESVENAEVKVWKMHCRGGSGGGSFNPNWGALASAQVVSVFFFSCYVARPLVQQVNV